jgi:hypothetical protein
MLGCEFPRPVVAPRVEPEDRADTQSDGNRFELVSARPSARARRIGLFGTLIGMLSSSRRAGA